MFKIGLQLIVMCLLSDAQRTAPNKEELIQDTVRKFLGFQSEERMAVPAKSQSLPPRYMMDLYERYRSGQTPMQGNTVRSILAMRAKVDSVDMLIFNLTGLKSTEQILQSKLYLLKRRRPKAGKRREHAAFRLSVGCLPDMPSKHPIDASLARQKPEWHSYDISESVVSCRQIRRGSDSLLGITLDARRPRGGYRPAAFRRLVKPDSQPFVLIFSEDSQNLSTASRTNQDASGEIGDLLRTIEEGLLPENFRPSQGAPSRRAHRHRGKRSNDDLIGKDLESRDSSDERIRKYLDGVAGSLDLEKHSRCGVARWLPSVVDNIRRSFSVHRELTPEHETEPASNRTVDKKVLFSGSSQRLGDPDLRREASSGRRSKRTLSDAWRYSTEVNVSGTVRVFDESYLRRQSSEVFPKPRGRKWHQRKHRKKRRRNRKLLPFWWTRRDGRLHARDVEQMCRRKSLRVDFSRLGWDDWILSPKSFDAYFCEGSCTFPAIKHTETSNHAAVQSLIHAMGVSSHVPTPSCVPSATRSLPLLYLDEDGGLVLRSYPSMIVERCGCR